MKFNRRTPGLIGLVALLLIHLGCGTTRKITVHSDPAGAELSIDGREVGTTPTTQELKFDDKKPSFELEVKKTPEAPKPPEAVKPSVADKPAAK